MESKGKGAAVGLPARDYSPKDITPVALKDMKAGMVILARKVPRFIDMSPALGLSSSRKEAKGYACVYHPAVVLNVDLNKGGVEILISTSAPNGLADKHIKKENYKYFVSVAEGQIEPGQPDHVLQPEKGPSIPKVWFITYASAFVKPGDGMNDPLPKDKYAVMNDYTFSEGDIGFLHTELGRVKTQDNNSALDQAASQRK